jgi:hypothetical protein
MSIEEDLIRIKNLYENIFDESADNSKEFINFANGNPHPLRLKVEDWLTSEREALNDPYHLRSFGLEQKLHQHVGRINSAFELDCLIMNYIENNG